MQMIHKFRRTSVLLAVLAIALLAFAGCGSDDDTASDDTATTTTETTQTETATTEDSAATDDAATQVVNVGVVSGELKFDPETLDAKAGKVTFKFDNPDSIPHDFAIEQDGKKIDGTDIISQAKAEFTVDLTAGAYDFYCTPHRAAGMVGKLTVA